MGSYPAECRRSMQRQDSTRSNSGSRRPRLLRATATEPSITPSNASRGVLASPPPSRRATEILTQVAYVSGASSPEVTPTRSSPLTSAARTPVLESPDLFGSSPSSHASSLDDYQTHNQPGAYFSFPSFDAWDMSRHEDADASEEKSP